MELFLMHQVTSTLLACANKIRRYGDLCHPDVPLNQWMVLFAVTHLRGDAATAEGVCKMLGCTGEFLQQTALKLEAKGYLELSVDDSGNEVIVLTESGKQAQKDFYEKCVPPLMEMAKQYTLEEADQLWELLRRMYAFDGEELLGLETHGSDIEPE